jgi:hypothetical protein
MVSRTDTVTMTALLTKKELEDIRAAEPLTKNAAYHATMHELVEEAKKKIDLGEIRQHFLDEVRKAPEKSSFTYFYRLNLEPLFRSKQICQKDSEGNYKWMENPVPPLELWLDCPKARLTQYDTWNPEYHRPGMRRIILDKSNHTYFRHTLEEYIYTTDPDIQSLRKIFEEAFPEAQLAPSFFAHPGGQNAHLDIQITYNLNQVIPSLETYTHVWRGETNNPGDCARWIRNQ